MPWNYTTDQPSDGSIVIHYTSFNHILAIFNYFQHFHNVAQGQY